MKFYIGSILLWPKGVNLKYRRVKFEPDKINIITGVSGTGKSVIIPITDYYFGPGKCTILVGTIRNVCTRSGVPLNLENERLLLCRRESGNQMAAGDMFIFGNKETVIPESIETNTTLTEVKNVSNELSSMLFLDLDPAANDLSSHPSYRDLMVLLFQPRSIVANADVLLYKVDTTEHRQKLINIFSCALGAVAPKVLAARQGMDELKKQRDRLPRDIKTTKDVSEGRKQEVTSWLAQAGNVGLTPAHFNECPSPDDRVQQFEAIVEKAGADTQLVALNIRDSLVGLVELRKKEQDTAS